MTPIYKGYYKTEIGMIVVTGTEEGVMTLDFTDEKISEIPKIPACLKKCITQIGEYFEGKRKIFSVPLLMKGTDFQKKVWKELTKIPFGEKVSYKDIATTIGNEDACRAVGSANGKNPVSIIIPCHRVIGTNGKLTGYGGGLWRKEWLLKHEANLVTIRPRSHKVTKKEYED
jgi:methylated-DNA-[protein]-cysteine S-methyltransferase